MNKNEDSLDYLIKEEIQNYAKSIEVSDIDQAWKDFEKNMLGRKKRVKNLSKFAVIAAILILILFSSIFVSFNNQAVANFWFLEKIKTTIDEITSISITTSKQEQPESQDKNIEDNTVTVTIEKKLLSLEEASQLVSYPIVLPTYIPSGYSLNGVYLDNPESKTTSIELQYSTPGIEEKLIINQIPTNNSTGFSHNFRGTDVQEKTVLINNNEATLLTFNNRLQLIWQYKTFLYIITGAINEDEIIKMAESIRL
ncbi:DUF4367 domain-containing protein [Desulfitibacter alkalitolerans]|uniref:DUF4367 domain-containing protein n=1 Tax=Desulfitibacter alkalitolerans TaxID=264641 RepID=UPI000489BE1B|nr:DUF4367 domain-containing protein [Desulfitibacter alkalitolerans]